MATKQYDIAVVTGSYNDSQGNKKNRYQNVGAVIQGDKGPYILLERWFNPAGIVNPDGRSNVLLSLFEPKQGDQSAPARTASAPSDDFDDNVPF